MITLFNLLKTVGILTLLLFAKQFLTTLWRQVRLFNHAGFWELPGDNGWQLVRIMLGFHEKYSKMCRIETALYFINTYPQKICRQFFFFLPSVAVFDAKTITEILITKQHNFQEKSNFSIMAKKFLGDTSMILTTGEMHRRHRAIGSNCFKASNLRSFSQSIQRSANKLVLYWNDKITNLEADAATNCLTEVIYDPLSSMALDIIMEIGLGIRQNCLKEPSEVSKLYQIILSSPGQAAGNLRHKSALNRYLEVLAIFPTPRNIYRFFILMKLHRSVDRIIADRMLSIEQTAKFNCTYLDVLVSALTNEKITAEEVRHELMTMLIAGHETTSNTLSWALMLLAKHPEVQEKARLEARTVLGNKNEFDYDSVSKLKFINAVICETLRLYPVICTSGRRSSKEEQLMGYTIPANVDVVILFIAMHRDPDVWENASEFEPSRFMKPDSEIPWGSWMPFGEGPHKCLGYQVALLEIKMCLAMLLSNFRFKLQNEDTKYEGMFYYMVMKSMPPVVLQISKA